MVEDATETYLDRLAQVLGLELEDEELLTPEDVESFYQEIIGSAMINLESVLENNPNGFLEALDAELRT